jgi:uncharacterized membrane protein required for colicin V production
VNALDLVVPLLIVLAGWRGWFRGVLREALGLVGWTIGGLSAAILPALVSERAVALLGLPPALAEPVAGLAAFAAILGLCRGIGWLLARATRGIVPRPVDRTGGAALAGVKAVVGCMFVLLVFDARRGAPLISERIPDSPTASFLVARGWSVVAAVRERVAGGDSRSLEKPAGTSAGFLSK